MTQPICPSCRQPAKHSRTKFGDRHDCCGLWSWDGAPVVDAETHEARKAAHAAFDALWKSKLLTRKEAYRLLAAKLQIKRSDCHIKLFSKEVAGQVPRLSESMRAEACR